MVFREKLELVAEIQGVSDKTKFLPLFLTGGAFSVYQSLSKIEKEDYNGLKKALLSAFSADEFKAFEKIK